MIKYNSTMCRINIISSAIRIFFLVVVLVGVTFTVSSQKLTRYMLPPKELVEIIDAPSAPTLIISPDRKCLLFAKPQEMPDIQELAQPELKLAGIRINPTVFGQSRKRFYTKLTIRTLDGLNEISIKNIPDDGMISDFRWSPDSKHIAFSLYRSRSIELWVVDAATSNAKMISGNISEVLASTSFCWLSDSKTIVYTSVPENQPTIPEDEALPEGPIVQETSGVVSTVWTYQDLLKNPTDERKFEHYATSQLVKVSVDGSSQVVGNPCLISNFSPSPDGKYLLVEQVTRPFSYTVPYDKFPTLFEIWDLNGKTVKRLAEIPLTENVPQGFSATRKGPREYEWRADVSATIVWVEAQDGGDPKKVAEIRDKLFFLEAPFKGSPVEFLSLNFRFDGISWGWDQFAIVKESWWETRKELTSSFNPSKPNESKKLIWDRSSQDSYSNPGNFVTAYNQWGERVLLSDKDKKNLYLSGIGSSPDGDLPFLDEFEIKQQKTTRLWRCKKNYFETFVDFVDFKKRMVVTSRESQVEQPNFFIRDIKRDKLKQITFFPHPFPMLKDVSKEMVTYKRKDGLRLTGTLYLPAGYKKGSSKLPVLMWAYPEEFVDSKLAGQMKGSPSMFIRPGRLSPMLWVMRGYAVFDNLGMPIVGNEGKEPNDTFIEQLISNAQAAIDTLVAMKVADPKRVAIGGHSYGAFMTANLMAHCDLFAAGIARSGAYNRTLTPFGFQSEERTYWQAPDVYNKISPFMYADSINEPLLLIHGEADNNTGTFPMQSERLYAAIKGHGGTARLVILPFESHGYRARQSIMHTVWEMDCWLDKYVKNRKIK